MNYCRYLGFLFSFFFLLTGCIDESRKPLVHDDFVGLMNDPSLVIKTGSTDSLLLIFHIKSPYHIMANDVEDGLIPTQLKMSHPKDIQLGSAQFPASQFFELSGTTDPIKVYEKSLVIKIPVSISSNNSNGPYNLNGVLSYQACDSRKCYFPRELDFQLEVKIE